MPENYSFLPPRPESSQPHYVALPSQSEGQEAPPAIPVEGGKLPNGETVVRPVSAHLVPTATKTDTTARPPIEAHGKKMSPEELKASFERNNEWQKQFIGRQLDDTTLQFTDKSTRSQSAPSSGTTPPPDARTSSSSGPPNFAATPRANPNYTPLNLGPNNAGYAKFPDLSQQTQPPPLTPLPTDAQPMQKSSVPERPPGPGQPSGRALPKPLPTDAQPMQKPSETIHPPPTRTHSKSEPPASNDVYLPNADAANRARSASAPALHYIPLPQTKTHQPNLSAPNPLNAQTNTPPATPPSRKASLKKSGANETPPLNPARIEKLRAEIDNITKLSNHHKTRTARAFRKVFGWEDPKNSLEEAFRVKSLELKCLTMPYVIIDQFQKKLASDTNKSLLSELNTLAAVLDSVPITETNIAQITDIDEKVRAILEANNVSSQPKAEKMESKIFATEVQDSNKIPKLRMQLLRSKERLLIRGSPEKLAQMSQTELAEFLSEVENTTERLKNCNQKLNPQNTSDAELEMLKQAINAPTGPHSNTESAPPPPPLVTPDKFEHEPYFGPPPPLNPNKPEEYQEKTPLESNTALALKAMSRSKLAKHAENLKAYDKETVNALKTKIDMLKTLEGQQTPLQRKLNHAGERIKNGGKTDLERLQKALKNLEAKEWDSDFNTPPSQSNTGPAAPLSPPPPSEDPGDAPPLLNTPKDIHEPFFGPPPPSNLSK